MRTIETALKEIRGYSGRPVRIMEICGTHSGAILKSGIRSLLPPEISLVSGPGCPVCVTSVSVVDTLTELAMKPDSCVLCFGDMLRIPGGAGSLADAVAKGGRVKIIYSPLDVVDAARTAPEIQFYLAAVGFETTAPAYALLLEIIAKEKLANIKLVTALKRTIPAIEAILSGDNRIDALICPGHVAAVIGAKAFEALAQKYQKPFVVAGFESAHIVAALREILGQITENSPRMVNLYPEAVPYAGNIRALALLDRFFVQDSALWRGIGVLEASGYQLKPEFSALDVSYEERDDDSACACGDVLIGKKLPPDCPMYATACTPAHPYGPCMVSQEGACGLWFNAKGGEV